jgi:hypothetical protein
MVTATRDALAQGARIFPTFGVVVGIGLEQAARPLGFVA